jgi:hypothetical protein
MRSTKISKMSFIPRADEAVIVPESVVPVRYFQPDFSLRTSSVREMCADEVEDGESFPPSVA